MNFKYSLSSTKRHRSEVVSILFFHQRKLTENQALQITFYALFICDAASPHEHCDISKKLFDRPYVKMVDISIFFCLRSN